MIFARTTENMFEAIFGEGFQKVVEGVNFESAEGVVIVRSNENHRRHVVGADGVDHGESVARRHLDVEENKIGLEFLDGGDRGVATGGFADDLDVGLLTKKALDFAARRSFVVNYENFQGNRGHHSGGRAD